MMFVLAMVAAAATACFAVPGANITAGDLAKAVPAFTPLDAQVAVSYAPSPGARRIFHAVELEQVLSRRFSFSSTTPLVDACFERVQTPLTNAAVLQAMHDTLGPTAQIAIEELSRFPVPTGEVIFPRETLGTGPIALWHGYVRYDGVRKFAVWARVSVQVHSTYLLALEDLKPGLPIRASQLKLVESDGFPERHSAPPSAEAVEGCIPRHFIPADSPVWTDSYNPPNDINKGDRVVVFVHSGGTDLTFDADAQTSGRKGDAVDIKNPESGRVFRALIEGPGKAGVQTFR